jgi:hypothetical protein
MTVNCPAAEVAEAGDGGRSLQGLLVHGWCGEAR